MTLRALLQHHTALILAKLSEQLPANFKKNRPEGQKAPSLRPLPQKVMICRQKLDIVK